MKGITIFFYAILFFLTSANSFAAVLWWNIENKPSSMLYGEITVLATHEGIYYAGSNWFPGEQAGGYCGIQDNTPTERRTIFSIWDTDSTKNLRPKITQADSQTIFNNFDNEGSGAHSHMVIQWNVGETFRFFLTKMPSQRIANSIDTKYYFFDKSSRRWRHVTTITNPIGSNILSVSKIGGGLNSFLENFTGKDREVAKIALYRLWLGDNLDNMMPLTQANGDAGLWGEFADSYFLAEGSDANLDKAFAPWKKYGQPVYGKKGTHLPPISSKKMSESVINQLRNLPSAPHIK